MIIQTAIFLFLFLCSVLHIYFLKTYEPLISKKGFKTIRIFGYLKKHGYKYLSISVVIFSMYILNIFLLDIEYLNECLFVIMSVVYLFTYTREKAIKDLISDKFFDGVYSLTGSRFKKTYLIFSYFNQLNLEVGQSYKYLKFDKYLKNMSLKMDKLLSLKKDSEGNVKLKTNIENLHKNLNSLFIKLELRSIGIDITKITINKLNFDLKNENNLGKIDEILDVALNSMDSYVENDSDKLINVAVNSINKLLENILKDIDNSCEEIQILLEKDIKISINNKIKELEQIEKTEVVK